MKILKYIKYMARPVYKLKKLRKNAHKHTANIERGIED
jgi:hypothetical protein